MKEVILCKYGEIILKGANKASFESKLLKEVKRRAARYGNFSVRYMQSTVYVEPLDEAAEFSVRELYGTVKHVFGFAAVCLAAVCEKEIGAICRTAAEYLPEKLAGAVTFRAEAKRSDKRFPLTSPEVAAEVGGAILDAMPNLKVDLDRPDVTVRVEIRDKYAYVHAGQEPGAGGIPVGTGGRGLLLLSGGIDSPVAGYMMMKRGLFVDAVHFESFPYTSELARDKVFSLAKLLTEYCGMVRVHVVSLTEIQEAIRDNCDEPYFTILLRRFMMRLACRIAAENEADVLITGERLGQVASQTMKAMCATEDASTLPIFRPCIGLDKDEIVRISRAIGTYETSILPYEDCCTVFTPRHPKTKPELDRVLAEEKKLDVAALEDAAFEQRYHKDIRQYEYRKGTEQE
ncbi:MAG: tRNA 4-thiouridine(8) synthase ThiI [Clostridia bacterium]|nr:tRNA 4-thiouridine(8) synthase ThiI [Clostridia bacterium]